MSDIEEKCNETSRTSTSVSIHYSYVFCDGGERKYNSFRKAVSLFAGRKFAVKSIVSMFKSFRSLDSTYLYQAQEVVIDREAAHTSSMSLAFASRCIKDITHMQVGVVAMNGRRSHSGNICAPSR